MNTYQINVEKQIARDMRILFHLYSGVDTPSGINAACWLPENRISNISNCRRRLLSLCEMGYVKKIKFSKCVLYALDERGTNDVCNCFNIERDEVRNKFPSSKNVLRELAISGVVRTVRNEVLAGRYSVEYVRDQALQKLYKKIFAFEASEADLRLKLFKKDITYDIFVDEGKKPQQLLKKIEGTNTTFILLQDSERLEHFRDHIVCSQIDLPVGIALAADFCRDGLVNAIWDWPFQNSSSRLVIDADNK